ncbi:MULTISPECIES: hypothetical protein [unclassified Fibrobacter]|uniref:hypothetical protein n=1 Tax=unclassified Fibrobacter TaxID=2634177 RepID=UPI0011B1CD45|nr:MULTISPECIES: hypothetical protein [unclassified Fibrobacter]
MRCQKFTKFFIFSVCLLFCGMQYSYADIAPKIIKSIVGTGTKNAARTVVKKSAQSGVKKAAKTAVAKDVAKKSVSSGAKKSAGNVSTISETATYPKFGTFKRAYSKDGPVTPRKPRLRTYATVASANPVFVAAESKIKQGGLASIEREVVAIQSKGPIVIEKEMMQKLLDHPEYLKNYVKATTGAAGFGSGYKEFFIRVAQDSKENVKTLWSNGEIKEMTKTAIRKGGGKHEWLMAKNVEYFLTDPSLGDNGPKLFYAIDKFVQKTKNVQLKNGITHYNGGDEVEFFHKELSKIIESEKTGDIRAIGLKIKHFAQENLSLDSYRDFLENYNTEFR